MFVHKNNATLFRSKDIQTSIISNIWMAVANNKSKYREDDVNTE